MYFSLLITRHSKHLLVKFQVPVGMEAIQKACVWPGKDWLTGNSHMPGCKTFSLSQQGSLYPRLLQAIIFLLQLHILQLPTDHRSKVLCHRIPTCLRPLQCCPANLPQAFLYHSMFMQSSAPQTAKWVTSTTTGFVHLVWPASSMSGPGPKHNKLPLVILGTNQCFHTDTNLWFILLYCSSVSV